MSSAVLLAEPEEATRSFLERHLAQDGFEVVGVTEEEALELLERVCPDLVLIGDPEGLELCRRLRERDREVPVILLGSQESDPVDRVRAFDRGCDDYLDRPFHYDELVARIRAVLRRVAPPESERMTAGEIEIDRPTRRVTVAGRRVELPTKEYELLLKLASDPSRVFTKDELLRDVWGFRSAGRTRTLGLARVPAPAPSRRRLCPQRLGRRILPTRRLSWGLPRRPSAGIESGANDIAPAGTVHGMTSDREPAGLNRRVALLQRRACSTSTRRSERPRNFSSESGPAATR